MTANQINYARHLEDVRTHKVQEGETYRHNIVQEGISQGTLNESVRHNLVTEDVSQQTLLENKRHNLANESISYGNLLELSRHNTATESIQRSVASETARHNLISEQQTETRNLSERQYWSDTVSAKEAANKETARHNEEMETLSAAKTGLDFVTGIARTVGSVLPFLIGG